MGNTDSKTAVYIEIGENLKEFLVVAIDAANQNSESIYNIVKVSLDQISDMVTTAVQREAS